MIPGFEIIEEVGRGGMGTVYRARQICLDRIVALKILPHQMAGNAVDAERFKREARAAAQLSHPGIVQIFESGEAEGTYYYAMEYIEGYSVATWITQAQVIPEEHALVVAMAVADALDYAWTKAHLIHRDIKPENVLIGNDGVVKVADLGLAKMVDSRMTITMPGESLGTPNYCSPEQARADSAIDCRTDIYSLGAMLYNMLTGVVPFGDIPSLSAMVRHITHQLDDPQALKPGIFPGTVILLEKMMAKNPGDRHADWKEVLPELKRVHRHLPPLLSLPQGAVSTVTRKARTLGASPAPKTIPGSEERKKVAGRTPVERKVVESEPIRSGRSRAGIIAAVVGIVVVILAILIAANVKSSGPSHAQGGSSAQPVPKRIPGTDVEAEVGVLFQEAKDYAARNPNDFDGAIAKLRDASAKAAGTRMQTGIDDEIRTIEMAKQRAIQKVLDDLQRKAGLLADQGKRAEAAAIYRTYSGPLSDATVAQRETLAKAYESVPKNDKDALIKEIYDMAVLFAQRNQNEYDSAIKRFQEVAERGRGSAYEEKALSEMRRIAQVRDAAVQDLMNRLKQQADQLVAQGRSAEARALYRNYQGPLAAGTVEQRMKAAGALDQAVQPVAVVSSWETELNLNQKRYQENKQQFLDNYTNNLQHLSDEYLRVLKEFEDAVRKIGDRDRLTRVEAERTRFLREKDCPKTPPAQLAPELRKIQAQYLRGREDVEHNSSKGLVDQLEIFAQFLGRLEVRYQSMGLADGVSAVRDLRNKLYAEQCIKDAQQVLKTSADKTKK